MRAWCYLVWFCFQRQARARQMVWIALALLAFTTILVGLNTAAGRWGMRHWRWTFGLPENRGVPNDGKEAPKAVPPFAVPVVLTWQEIADEAGAVGKGLPAASPALAGQQLITSMYGALLDRSGFSVFSTWIVFSIFLSFLLPIWSLSFATEALGGEREARSLVWLLTRPLPRPMIYLAKYLGLLPWAVTLNVGGFAVICLAAGPAGREALALFWPAVLWGTFAFCSLFHLMAAVFRRAAVVALVYSFFLETLLGNMPGLLKRVSLGFYTRCMMFEAAQEVGLQPEKPSIYLPVSGAVAWAVLAGVTVGLLAVGMAWFSRAEYQDLT